MVDINKAFAKFGFTFPPADREKNGRRNTKAKRSVPDQPGIEYLLLRSLANKLEIPADKDMWRELALILARDKFPEPKPEGAPKKWNKNLKIALIGEVTRLLKQKELTLSSACLLLAKKELWKKITPSNDAFSRKELLRKRYYDLKINKEFFQEATLQFKTMNKQDTWSAFIEELEKEVN